MSRGFTGMRSEGFKMGVAKMRAKEMAMLKMQGKKPEQLSSEEQYKKIIQEKVDKLRKSAETGAKYSVILPGTERSENKRKMSKSTQELVDALARKRAKKEAKKKRAALIITPKYFTGPQGGRIDKDGNIYGPGNRLVAYVDKKSGKVRSAQGARTICKYSHSSFCEYRIAQFIAQIKAQQASGNSIYRSRGWSKAAAEADVWGGQGTKGFWGGGSGSGGGATGGFWGGGTGGFWG